MPARFGSEFTLGGPVAESDPLLGAGYFDNGDYSVISSMDDHRSFLIGRTGSGKSALLKKLEEQFPEKVVRIAPENLSLPYITNLDVVRQLNDLNVRLDPFFNALWKHVILVEILRHRYEITSPQRKQTFLHELGMRLRRDPGKKKALEYLDEFGDKFWCEADERVKQIADSFERKIEASGGIQAGVPGVGLKASASLDQTERQEVRRELADKYQKIVNETQLPRLNQMITVLSDEILDSLHVFTYLVVDDLDKDWVDDAIANLLIRCLFQAALDMQRVEHLKIIVALRTNIFQSLNYADQRRGGQEEKVRALSLHIKWTRNDLERLLDHRLAAAFQNHRMHPLRTIKEILPKAPSGDQSPLPYILDRTLMRPRDAIIYLNYALRESIGKESISWTSIEGVEREYSKDRLFALRDEWKEPYFGIEVLFEVFRNASVRLSRDELSAKIDQIALLPADHKFRGTAWLSPLFSTFWTSKGAGWFDDYGPMAKFLYAIGFIGLGKAHESRATYVYDDELLAESPENFPESCYVEVHPAFRPALDISAKRKKALPKAAKR